MDMEMDMDILTFPGDWDKFKKKNIKMSNN